MRDQQVQFEDLLRRFSNPRRLGRGGQKQVYLIDHPVTGRAVAKIGCYSSPESLERIRREVSILQQLNSPHFPRQISFEIVDSQRFVIVEEYIEGTPLASCLGDYSQAPRAFGFLSELITPLVGLWERRTVHRDLKPENIIISNNGPVIIDLGIARVLDSISLTQSLAPFGPCTPNYAAPEQLQNRKHEIDHRSDQFCLGIILGQLILGGQHPFATGGVESQGSIPENILAARWARDPLKARLTSIQYSVVDRMLGPQPYMRFRKPSVLLEAIDGVRINA